MKVKQLKGRGSLKPMPNREGSTSRLHKLSPIKGSYIDIKKNSQYIKIKVVVGGKEFQPQRRKGRN